MVSCGVRIAVCVPLLRRKPCCLSFCRLFSSWNVWSLLFSILLSNFPSTLSSEISRLSLTPVPLVPAFGMRVIVACL